MKLKKLTRAQGVTIQTAGMLIIVSVMLIDHFLFAVQQGFILACAVLSLVLLIIGIRTVKRAELEAEAEQIRQAQKQKKQKK